MIALAIILGVFLLLLAAPMRSYAWAIAIAAPVYAWLYWITTRPLPSSDHWGSIDRAIVGIALFFGVLTAVFRLVFSRRRSEVGWRPAQASCLFVAIWVAVWLLTPTVPVLAGAATCIAIGLVLTLAMFGMAARATRHRLLFISAGTALLVGAIAILIWPLAVVAAAEKRAAGRPYCLLVAHGIKYRTANNLLDLTPLIMRGREGNGPAMNHHGEMLIAGEENRNWSYSYSDFVDRSSDQTPQRCEAAIGFARELPWF